MNASQCLNPDCLRLNPITSIYCDRCRSKLKLGDRYLATHILGEGGFGRTFAALDQHRLNTPCVIKQFLPQDHNSQALQKATALFQQEAQQLFELGKHPQIPDLLAFFEQEERLYLIQELIDGQDLAKELKAKGQFSEIEVQNFLLELLPVLQFIHDKNIIHRDIKPDNIIRHKNGKLFLIDFGVSKQLIQTVMTRIGTTVGTIGYAAPEQMRGIVYPNSDLYSLGVTAIRLLTGCIPTEENGAFTDPLFNAQAMQWCWQEKLEADGIEISKKLKDVLDKLLQERSNQRFQSATEVIKALSFTTRQNSANRKYQQLEEFLKRGQWREADLETRRLILQIAGRTKQGNLNVKSINSFPCSSLSIINNLWMKYSQGHFGFSVQKEIYLNCKSFINFAKEVNWYVDDIWLNHNDYIFDLSAPKGHLPTWMHLIAEASFATSFEIAKYVFLETFLLGSIFKSPDSDFPPFHLISRILECDI